MGVVIPFPKRKSEPETGWRVLTPAERELGASMVCGGCGGGLRLPMGVDALTTCPFCDRPLEPKVQGSLFEQLHTRVDNHT